MNLNLFVALNAILNARTLTEAAASAHVTQSAMSASLRKLREHFDNPIILYARGGSTLTPLGEALRPKVAEMIELGRDMLAIRETFDPLSSRATFRLATNDSVEIILLPRLLEIITQAAPHVKIVSANMTYSGPDRTLEDAADVIFVREGLENPKLQRQVVYSDTFVVIARSDHPDLPAFIGLDQFRSLPHAAIQRVETAANAERNKAFAALYDGVDIAVTTRSFAALAQVVAGTRLIGVIPGRVATVFARSMPLRILDFPVPLPDVNVLAQWQAYKTSEAAMIWLLETIQAASRHLGVAPVPAALSSQG